METRTVQLSGGTTYTVSLPKAWATEHGIDAGSEVGLHPNEDGTLLVEAGGDCDSTERSASVDISTCDRDAVRNTIHALHAVGFESVSLRDDTGHADGDRTAVESAVAQLSGFELLEVTDTRIELHNLIDAENLDVRKSVIRLRLVALGMHRDATTALIEGDASLARQVVERDNEADKLFAMVTRHFRRALADLQEVEKLGTGREALFEYFYAARQFERVADHAEKMARFVLDEDATIPTDLETTVDGLANDARSVVDDAASVVLSDADLATAHGALGQRDALHEAVESLDRDLYAREDPVAAWIVGLVLDSIGRTAEYGANVAAMALQQRLRETATDV